MRRQTKSSRKMLKTGGQRVDVLFLNPDSGAPWWWDSSGMAGLRICRISGSIDWSCNPSGKRSTEHHNQSDRRNGEQCLSFGDCDQGT